MQPRFQRVAHLSILLVGIIVGQFILYGPSLIGRKILLPLDLLAQPGWYLPMTPEVRKIVPHDLALSDQVLQFETERLFTAAELRAGRLPLWAPYQYAGVPLVWPKFSPFVLMQVAWESPVVLAWVQLVEAVVAGVGAYLFCRRALEVGFWPAVIVGWCYPLTGFFVFWQGLPTCNAVYWLGWILLAVDRAVLRPSIPTIAALSAVTCLVLISGHVDVAGQTLLASGLYGLWRIGDTYKRKSWQLQGLKAVGSLTIGWTLGFFLAAPHVLPLVEYAGTGSRMQSRAGGKEERAPGSIQQLPQVVLPDMYGATTTGSLRIVPFNQIEASAAVYAGVLATLLAAPLAWCSRRHRSFMIFSIIAGLLALSWCLNVPGIVSVLRLPGLRMLSHNRMVFFTSFLILALAAIGLDALWRGQVQQKAWFWLPAVLLGGLCAWCVQSARYLPEPIATEIGTMVAQGKPRDWVRTADDVRTLQNWFIRAYGVAGALCALGAAGWVILLSRQKWQRVLVPVMACLMTTDLLWFAYGRSAQCDPKLYFPRIKVLEDISKSLPGRVVGFTCLPATLAQTHGLLDIRGYDGIDPAQIVQLTASAATSTSPKHAYAIMQWFTPEIGLGVPDQLRLSPILDMLGVRYVIFRGTPPRGFVPHFEHDDYWALINQSALPRAFIPQRIQFVADATERISNLSSSFFNPGELAYVELPVSLPDDCRGDARIVSETPTNIKVAIQMQTPGLVVLADQWDKGWRATLDGKPVPILRTNHAVRGVVVPAGNATLEFRYMPGSLVIGLWLAAMAAVLIGGAVGWHLFTRR